MTDSAAQGDAVRALRGKYERMRAMRLAHQDGTETAPRDEMRSLAADFPGALRELDELTMQTIEARLEALAAVDPPPWAHAMMRYHGWMRLALAVKRQFGKRGDPSAARRWLENDRGLRDGEPAPEALTDEALGAILRPPDGRLSRWVLQRIADETGRPVADIEGDVFKCLKKT